MASRNTISFLRSLQQKKFRMEAHRFVVEGPKMVKEALSSNFRVEAIFTTVDPDFDVPSEVEIEQLTHKELEQVSTFHTPHKMLALLEIPNSQSIVVPETGISILVDQVQDPGNLGTIIRIADWFGIKSVICSPDTVDCYNPKVVQASMGSLFRVPCNYGSLAGILAENASGAKLPVYATLLEGENIYKQELRSDALILMGNESRGVTPILQPFISYSIHIPAAQKGTAGAESLNVAVAAGIVCAEFRRQFPL